MTSQYPGGSAGQWGQNAPQPVPQQQPPPRKPQHAAITKTKEYAIGLLDHSGQDKELWSQITSFPHVSFVWKIIILILNICLPGTGTIMLSFLGHSCTKTHIAIGLVQLLLWWWIIGWIWSIYWGFLVFTQKSGDPAIANTGGQYNMGDVKQAPENPYEF